MKAFGKHELIGGAVIITCTSIGVGIGYALGVKNTRLKAIGTLRIDQSDPDDGPYLFLELYSPDATTAIMNSKQVIFDVNVKDYISHE